MPDIGPLELIIILVIVTMLFGVGRLPEVFGAVGKGIREFRRNMSDESAADTNIAGTDNTSSSESQPKQLDDTTPTFTPKGSN